MPNIFSKSIEISSNYANTKTKQTSRKKLESYRPLSLLSIMYKIPEELLLKRLKSITTNEQKTE